MEGTFIIETGSKRRVKAFMADGTVLIFDGESAWVSPQSSGVRRARFHLLTWPWFFTVPFKLIDPGSRLAALGQRKLQGKTYLAANQTFEKNTGDTPDDWYIHYRDPENNRLAATAYIVTYGKSIEAAEEEPHAILYDSFVNIDGVTFSTSWTFWLWSEENGIYGVPLFKAEVSNIEFVPLQPGLFEKPSDARLDVKPK